MSLSEFRQFHLDNIIIRLTPTPIWREFQDSPRIGRATSADTAQPIFYSIGD